MLYISTVRSFGKLVSARVMSTDEARDAKFAGTETRNDWRTFEAAEAVAKVLGDGYVATDAGPHVSPRYDVIKMPKIGDEVSYAFNGDSYPCGKITKISKSGRRIEADDGSTTLVFFRRKLTGSWINAGTWSLTPGHVYKQNPEF